MIDEQEFSRSLNENLNNNNNYNGDNLNNNRNMKDLQSENEIKK